MTVNVLMQGAQLLARVRHQSMTVPIVYRRGEASVALAAAIGATPAEQTDAEGVVYQYEARDYIVRVADLVLDGDPIEPQAGDQIVETRDGVEEVYDVLPLGSNGPAKFDPFRISVRIHTKRAE